jgi:cytochrome c553
MDRSEFATNHSRYLTGNPMRLIPLRYKTLALYIMGLTVLSLVAQSQAQQAAALPPAAAALYQQSLAATCANCHGPEGRVTPGSAVPGLAGLPSSYTVAQMQAFRSGSRPATVMHQISKGYTDAQVQSVADYFAAQSR